MLILSSILFAISANIDNFTVGIAYGIKNIKIAFKINLLIAVLTSAGTFISMSIGLVIVKFIPVHISNMMGSIILILMGLYFIADYFYKEMHHKNISTNDIKKVLDNPQNADKDNSGSIDIKEGFILGIALSLNNIGVGIGSSLAGLNITAALVFTFIFSIISLSLGYSTGKKCFSKIFGKYASIISGIIIIVLGVIMI